MNKTIILLIGLLIGSAIIGLTLKPQQKQNNVFIIPKTEASTVVPDIAPLPPFNLLDHQNTPFNKSNFTEKWSLIFFGYTHCPDVCPTTLVLFNKVHQLIEDEILQYIFVTVDPERDSTEVLKKYVTYFNPSFIGVTGEQNEINKLTKALGIFSSKTHKEGADKNYLVNHSAAILLISPEAKLSAIFSAPHHPEMIAKDYLTIKQWWQQNRERK